MEKLECTVDEDRFVRPCDRLSETLEDGGPYGNRKGIFAWELHNLRENKPSRTFIGVKGGEHRKKGLLFNFCPFCGVRIDAPFGDKPTNPEVSGSER